MADKEESIPLVLSSESLLATVSAEVDVQIATAQKFPRNEVRSLETAKRIACISEEVAESMEYALPRKRWDDKKGKYISVIIKGPSARLAEVIGYAFGHLRVASRVIGNDGIFITVQGVCHDLQTNYSRSVEVKRSIKYKTGRTFNFDMQVMAMNAAGAIASRNATFQVIPAALVNVVYEAAREKARGTAESLPGRRENALKYFIRKGITEEQIIKVLQVVGIENIDLENLATLRGFKNVLEAGEATLDEIFPAKDEKDKADTANDTTFNLMQEEIRKAEEKGGKGKDKKQDSE
jgi:hypothetical protein